MPENPVNPQTNQPLTPRYLIRLPLTYLLIPALLFACAGDFAWPQAWIFAVPIVTVGIFSCWWGERRHPGLMAERLKSETNPGVKPWDKVLAPLMAVSISFPVVIVAGLDHRYGWSPSFPPWFNLLGFVLITCGYIFAAWALAENRFFSGTVRIQSELGHTVCDSGLYRIVRHPGYAGNILPQAGYVLALNSLWSILPGGFALAVILVRTALEHRSLLEELPGYVDYAYRVRYRLFAGVY